MKQLILVGNQKVKFQDTETTISLTLVSDGNTVTIDKSKTYSVKIKNGTGYIKAIEATPNMVNNMVSFETSGFNGLPVDAYFIELWVIDKSGQTIYPSDSFIEVDITANATGVKGQVLPAITMQEFEDRFKNLQSNLEAKVGTLIGPTGKTGNGINTVVTEYQLSSSGSEVPKGSWSQSPVTPTDTLPYMWTRNVTTYTDKSTHVSYNISAKGTTGNHFTIQGHTSSIAGLPHTGTDGEGYMVGTELYVWTNGKWNDIVDMKGVQGDKGIQGIRGVKGNTGNGISSVTTEYELSKQGTEIPNTGWGSTLLTMTNDLPYLWTRVTITFTNGSKNMVYFTSNKGDKGDTGKKGDKGDTGANLAVKGAVDKNTELPSSGNTEGDAYLVGINLYVYTNKAWKNCGPIVAENTVLYNADGSLNVNGTNYNYVQDLRNGKIQYNNGTKNIELTPVDSQKEAEDILSARNYTDASIKSLSTSIDTKLSNYATNSQLATKADDSKVVHDNKDGTEQLNGVQVQPFNKLSDTIGGRNLLVGTSGDLQTAPDSASSISGGILHQFSSDELSILASNQVTARVFIHNTTTHTVNLVIWTDGGAFGVGTGVPAGTDGYSTVTAYSVTSSSTAGNISIRAYTENAAISGVQYKELKLEKGSVATDWTPAPEDKVNVSDMRKPASDVAGIEEVNAKQDKIGYTPADDSKVAHLSGANNFDTVPTVNNNPLLLASSLPSDLARTGSDQEFTGKNTFDTAPIDKATGTPYITKSDVPKVDLSSYATKDQLATKADDSKVVHSTDMRKPASDVAGIEEVNTKQDKIGYTPADDSKVAHLSGDNNFDTIPMVNNNPLVTASQTGDVSKLLTKDKSSYVNSINELASIVDRFYPVASQVIPTDNISYSNQGLVYNYDPSNNTVTFRKNDSSYSINYDTSVVGTNFTENAGGSAPLDGIRIYFGFKAIHYINKTESTLSDINYYAWNPNDSSTIKSGELGLLKDIPYYLTSENFEVGSNYTVDFSGNGMNLSTSGNNRISPRLIISNKGNGVLNITPYHGEDFKDDKSEGYWIYPYITKIVSYSVDTTAMKALPNGYSYDYVKDKSASKTGNYLTAWGQGSYQYKFDLNNLGNGYSIDSMGSSITINVSIKGTDSSSGGYNSGSVSDGYKSSKFPNSTFNSGGQILGRSYVNLTSKLSKEGLTSGSSYTAYCQEKNVSYGAAVFYAIKLTVNNDNTISIYVINPVVNASYDPGSVPDTDPSQSVHVSFQLTNTTTISVVNNV